MKLSQVILKPILTEKSVALQQQGIWSFYVDPGASKTQISEALKKLFKVNPIKVRVMNVKPEKKVSWRKRTTYNTKRLKKALVWLPEKEEIKSLIVKSE